MAISWTASRSGDGIEFSSQDNTSLLEHFRGMPKAMLFFEPFMAHFTSAREMDSSRLGRTGSCGKAESADRLTALSVLYNSL